VHRSDLGHLLDLIGDIHGAALSAEGRGPLLERDLVRVLLASLAGMNSHHDARAHG
jgi:hypothetical protein